MQFWCQTFSLMFAKPHVMVLLIHRLISLKATIVAMIPSTKKCGETIGNARTNYRNVRFYS